MENSSHLEQIVRFASEDYDYTQLNFSSLSANYIKHNTTFTTSSMGMQTISHYIEKQALELTQPFKLYSGFQKLSRFIPQRHRYQLLCRLGQPLYIFGLADAVIPAYPNMEVIYLDEANYSETSFLKDYWFVVLQCSAIPPMALMCRELGRLPRTHDKPDKLIYRRFAGFWTFDQKIVAEIVGLLDNCIEECQPR